jgi:hypothetical protein
MWPERRVAKNGKVGKELNETVSILRHEHSIKRLSQCLADHRRLFPGRNEAVEVTTTIGYEEIETRRRGHLDQNRVFLVVEFVLAPIHSILGRPAGPKLAEIDGSLEQFALRNSEPKCAVIQDGGGSQSHVGERHVGSKVYRQAGYPMRSGKGRALRRGREAVKPSLRRSEAVRHDVQVRSERGEILTRFVVDGAVRIHVEREAGAACLGND